MTGQIIPLHTDEHREAQLLLPWYATGRLEARDHAQVEAHVATCAECQADLAFERRLGAAVADAPCEVEPGWEQLRRRLPPVSRKTARRPWVAPDLGQLVATTASGWRVGPRALGWTAAAQFVMLLVLGSLLVLRPPQPAQYQALGSAPAPAAGNLVVIFRPDTSEKALRAILNDNGARLVDGPTAADAYVLHVAPAQRAAALAKLRARREIVLAEPIDAPARP